MTTNMQMYISYLHSRFQQGGANHKQIRGSPMASGSHRCGFVALSHTNSSHAAIRRGGFSPHILPYKPAANAKTQAKNFLERTLNFEFNNQEKMFSKLKVSGFYAKAFGLKPF